MALPAYIAQRLVSITPSDTADLPGFGAIKCKGVAGDVRIRVETADGRSFDVTYPIALDETLEVDVRRVYTTGTTATGLWLFAR